MQHPQSATLRHLHATTSTRAPYSWRRTVARATAPMVWGMSSKKKLLRRSHSSASTKLHKSESMTASTSTASAENRLTEWSSMLHVAPSTSTADESSVNAVTDAVGQVTIEPSSGGSQTVRGHRPLARVSTTGGANPYQCPGSAAERSSLAKLDATTTQHSRTKVNSPADDTLIPIRDGCSCITYLAHCKLHALRLVRFTRFEGVDTAST